MTRDRRRFGHLPAGLTENAIIFLYSIRLEAASIHAIM
jgi:hypothetical protein